MQKVEQALSGYTLKRCIVQPTCSKFQQSADSITCSDCGHRLSSHLLHAVGQPPVWQMALLTHIRNLRCLVSIVLAVAGAADDMRCTRSSSELAAACDGMSQSLALQAARLSAPGDTASLRRSCKVCLCVEPVSLLERVQEKVLLDASQTLYLVGIVCMGRMGSCRTCACLSCPRLVPCCCSMIIPTECSCSFASL
jgi:hypothetical protein